MNIETTRDFQTQLAMRPAAVRRAIYACIVNSLRQEGVAPTVREMSRSVGIASLGHVEYHLTWLDQQGFIRRQRGTCRGIQLPTYVAGCALLGTVAGGRCHSFLSVVEDNLVQGEVPYGLLVSDGSLLEEHICSGDVLVIKPQGMSQQGELTVALHRQDAGQRCAVLKRFSFKNERRRGGSEVRCSPSQRWLRTETGRAWQQEWQVRGVVMSVARLY